MLDTPPEEWIETALWVTGHFEDSNDPLGGVTGDFDGMGVSLGVLQWNIGSGSLQPLVTRVGKATVVSAMPHYGAEFWRACTSTIPRGLATVRRWHVGTTLRRSVYDELKQFARSSAFVRQQIEEARKVAKGALNAAQQWAVADPSYGTVSKALFCWFFDLHTQNGGMKGLTVGDRFITANGSNDADDVICNWLANRSGSEAGYRDSHQNAVLWRNKVPVTRLSLFVASFLRSQKSRPQYRGDTLNRKATLAIGDGWVHGERHNLSTLLSG